MEQLFSYLSNFLFICLFPKPRSILIVILHSKFPSSLFFVTNNMTFLSIHKYSRILCHLLILRVMFFFIAVNQLYYLILQFIKSLLAESTAQAHTTQEYLLNPNTREDFFVHPANNLLVFLPVFTCPGAIRQAFEV